MIEKEFDADQLYNRIVHYYIDKKGYSKEQANSIAQGVIRRETRRRICANPDCGHPMHLQGVCAECSYERRAEMNSTSDAGHMYL